MRTAAILPVKRFSDAKQRLGESVADTLRVELARAMVGDVLSALRECRAVDTTIVVTREPSVIAAARYIGAAVVEDTVEDGQSAAVSLGVAYALAEGFERALCIPGDCPALDPGELEALLAGRTGGRGEHGGGKPGEHGGTEPSERGDGKPGDLTPEIVIVPDRHGEGTNGLVLSPPDAIVPSFGLGSRARHERLAEDAGAAWHIAEPSSLLLDVDTGEDLEELRARLGAHRLRAPRTRAVLDVTASRAA